MKVNKAQINSATLSLWARLCCEHCTSVLTFGDHGNLAAMPLCPRQEDCRLYFTELHVFNSEVNRNAQEERLLN